MKRLLLLLPVLLSSVACLSAKAQLSSYHFYLSHNAIHYCLYQEGYYSVDEYISEVTSFVEKTDISLTGRLLTLSKGLLLSQIENILLNKWVAANLLQDHGTKHHCSKDVEHKCNILGSGYSYVVARDRSVVISQHIIFAELMYVSILV